MVGEVDLLQLLHRFDFRMAEISPPAIDHRARESPLVRSHKYDLDCPYNSIMRD
jgi:hypothetical protein